MHHSGCDSLRDSSACSPDARGQTAEKEGAVSLDEGREEGKHTVYGERNEQGLSPTDPISQAAPDEGSNHHPQVNDQTCEEEEGTGTSRTISSVK